MDSWNTTDFDLNWPVLGPWVHGSPSWSQIYPILPVAGSAAPPLHQPQYVAACSYSRTSQIGAWSDDGIWRKLLIKVYREIQDKQVEIT